MNELMQKILLKAQQQAAAETIQNSLADESKVYEKFAELLIRECAEVVDNDDSSYPYDSFGHKLKQHFGVEE